jgi:hypothetical protein
MIILRGSGRTLEDNHPVNYVIRRTGTLLVVLAGLAVLLCAAGVFVLWPRTDRVTRRNFDHMREGMSRAEVQAILGSPNMTRSGMGELEEDEFPYGDGVSQDWGGRLWSEAQGDSEWQYWQGNEGVITVRFINGQAVGGEWGPRVGIVERIKRLWRKRFP